MSASYPPHRTNRPNPQSPIDQPATAPPQALLLTAAEAAERLRVRESWLRKKAAAREVPCTFLGKHLRFSPTDLTAIITAAARPATGRRARRRPTTTVRDRDLPPPADRSVHPRRDDHHPDGSTTWPG
jgi:excisionase family DNA binding protein